MIEEHQQRISAAPLLTIAVPTYNRADCLRDLLASLLDQLSNEPCVELVISDNASTDTTCALIEEYRCHGLALRYLRNTVNQGMDGNFLQCFTQAQGQYVWVLGDDDFVPPGTVAKIIELLTEHNPDFLFLTPREFRGDPRSSIPACHRHRATVVTDDGVRFTRMVGNMFTLISCNVVNKQRIDNLPHENLQQFLGTNLLQLGWSLPLLANFRKGVYVYDTLILVRGGNRSGYSISKVFGRHYQNITARLLGCNSKLAKILQRDVVCFCLPFVIMEARKGRFGNFVTEDYHAVLKPLYGNTLQYWLFLFPIVRGPAWLMHPWFCMIRIYRKINHILGLVA